MSYINVESLGPPNQRCSFWCHMLPCILPVLHWLWWFPVLCKAIKSHTQYHTWSQGGWSLSGSWSESALSVVTVAKLEFHLSTPQLTYIGTCGIEQRVESVILILILGLSAIMEHLHYIDWTDVISTTESMVRGTYFLLCCQWENSLSHIH